MNHLLKESNTGIWCLASLVSSAAGGVQLVDSLPDSFSTQGLPLGLLLYVKYLKSLDTQKFQSDCI